MFTGSLFGIGLKQEVQVEINHQIQDICADEDYSIVHDLEVCCRGDDRHDGGYEGVLNGETEATSEYAISHAHLDARNGK